MPSLFNAIFDKDLTTMNNEVIANDMLSGAKSSSTMYLQSALECATPELRRLFMQYSNQSAQSHETITALAVNKGWYKPYDVPSTQLTNTLRQSQSVLSND